MNMITNKFLKFEDYKLVSYQCIKKELEHIYVNVLKKTRQGFGSKSLYKSNIHWSRDWEYPWAIISSEVKSGEKVLDCGCGGSPLLPFLSKYGCKAYGIDPDIFKFNNLWKYYTTLISKFLKNLKSTFSIDKQRSNKVLKELVAHKLKKIFLLTIQFAFLLRDIIRRSSHLWSGFVKDPNKMGYKIKFFNESLASMHFKDKYFDKVYCISVIEHLPEDIAFKGIKEMARVLKKGGLLILTLDNDGPHVNLKLANKYQELIQASNLKLYGKCDFEKPASNLVPGKYNVIGFILKK